jgi:hypothetical protein
MTPGNRGAESGLVGLRPEASLDYDVPVFTDDVASSNYPVLRPGDLVSTEDDAGRECIRADKLE